MPFSLEAVFGVDTTGVRAGIKSLRNDLNSFVNEYAKLGAGIAVGAFVAMSKGAIELGSKLSDQAVQLGINVEKLQVLNAVARDAGVSQDVMAKAIVKTRTSASQAAEGLATYQRAFGDLGINVQQFLALPAEQRIVAIGRAYQQAGDKNAAYNAIAQIFGEKVGPKMMEVLGTLATDGFPAAEKSARSAGDVMSGETVAALDKAGDAIEAFKSRATMALGNIIVEFRSEAGLKLLGLQFLKVVGSFGAGILDALTEAGKFLGAVFTGAFKGTLHFFQDGLVDVVQGIAGLMNKVLPQKFEINVGNLEQFKSSGKSVADEITAAIAKTSPSTFKQELVNFYEGAIAAQKKVFDDANKADFGKAADNLRSAGKDIHGEVSKAAVKLADAGKAAAAPIAHAAEDLRTVAPKLSEAFTGLKTMIERVGPGYEDQTTASLQGVRARLNAQLNSKSPNSTSLLRNADMNTDYAGFLVAQVLRGELAAVDRELALRSQISSYAARYGEDAARRQFGDTDAGRALQNMANVSVQTANAVVNINKNLATLLGVPTG